jgi:hypothetical protein
MPVKTILTVSADFETQQVEIEPQPDLLAEDPGTQADAVHATIRALKTALAEMAPEQDQFEKDFERAQTRVNNHGTRQNLDSLEGAQVSKIRVLPDGALLLECAGKGKFLLSGGPEPIRVMEISATPETEFEGMCAFLERENGTQFLDFPSQEDLKIFQEGLDRGLLEKEDEEEDARLQQRNSKLN